MNRPDAVFTDLDGTLLGPDKKVGERDLAAIRRLKELGIPVIPCTGRPIHGVRMVMAELGLGLAVCSNGSCCWDFGRQELIYAVTIRCEVAERLVAWLATLGTPFLLHSLKRIYASPGASFPGHYLLLEGERGEDLTPETPLEGEEIVKVLAVRCDEQAVAARARELFRPEELTVCSSEWSFVDFNPPGVDKGIGVRRLAERMGWRMENILALGDNDNDLAMLAEAGMAAAPADALEEARKAAGFATAPCGEDPLTAALEHYFPGLL